MKSMKGFITTLSFFMILTACGQGDLEEETTIEDGNESEEVNADNDEDNNQEDDQASETNEDELSEIENLIVYFADDELMDIYKMETGETVTDDEGGAKQALNLWIDDENEVATPEGYTTSLPEGVSVQSVSFEDDIAVVSFSEELLEGNFGSAPEVAITEQITMIMEQFGYEQTKILIDDEEVETLYGHIGLDEPIQADSQDDYDELEQ
ncbi:GerMN domain-containing protein [Texcoconibacillus texcoconensis]|uniref:Spore germination protein GerM n=1 Tax=Texcoconibacillus texcoconensis TaxID=1095777 RepID=A0A840QSA7_9BACI|nr:GerMN domain-containing protein [Texcoconibacillus texcoconensis]MBB5174244.1 spore germination protein GerM [Texcoconibacillus texcoconensis]